MKTSTRSWVHHPSAVAHLVRVFVHGTRRIVQALHGLYLKINPNRAELETFRQIVRLEAILSAYPYAVPVLQRLTRLYLLTGEEEKRLETMRRLRDEPELPNFPAPVLHLVSEEVPSRELLIDRYYQPAVDFVQWLGFCSPTQLMMKFGIGFNVACGICDRLASNGVIEQPIPGQSCQALKGGLQ